MGTVNHEGVTRMYSWWWNSHICPKNSKWLLENLADMDDKVKQMIKLIEEDADSFARRAEMFYKKRPELMKLVEEFYRAYRALAERYVHATGVIRQAHKTMAEAFPNQVPTIAEDDLPADSAVEFDTRKNGMNSRPCSSICPDDLPKDSTAKALLQCNLFSPGGGRELDSFPFHDTGESNVYPVDDGEAHVLSEIELMIKNEMHIHNLRKAMSMLEDEKKAFAVQCQLSSERILNLEAEVARADENFRRVTEQVNESEREIESLKIALTKSEAINEEYICQYKESLGTITNLKNSLVSAEKDAEELKSQANKNELEVMILKQNLGELGSERESALLQYKHRLEMVSDLENKLQHAEKTVIGLHEQSNNAESEAQHLKEVLANMTEEKEAADFRCHNMLEMNSRLESKFSSAQDEVKRLKLELETQFAKLRSAEEKCLFLERSNQTLQLKQDSLLQKMETQNEELSYKQQELGRLWTCIQEERLRLMEKETALQNLQHLHFQSQEEVRSLAAKLQNGTQIAKDMETCNRCLQEEIQKVHEENKNLKELNLSSSLSIKSLNDEISELKEKTLKLEEDTELQHKQRAVHEQEISCLKEELDGLKKNCGLVQEQVDSTKWNGECINSSVKMLQDENSKLKEICDQERSEKLVLVEILAVMDKLLERNVLLEDSLSDLNAELDQTREKVKDLEVSCESLVKERSVLITERASLVSPLQIMMKSLEELKVNDNSENIAFEVNLGLEGTRVASRRVENTSLLLGDEKLDLVTETKSLASQLDHTWQKVEDMVARYQELERKYLELEKEKEIMVLEIAKLQDHLEIAKHENSTSATKLAIDRETIDENFRIQSEHFLALQNGMKKVMEMNKELKSEVLERVCNEELKNEIANLNVQISDLQHAFKCLQEENCKVLEEEHSLKTKVLELEEDKFMLQEDNDFILCETLHEGIISLVFQDVIFEQVSKLNELKRSLEKVCTLNSDLKENLRLMEENFLKLQMTNFQLMKSPEKSENDIKSLRSVVDLLCCDMAHVRDLLCLNEKKLLEAEKQDEPETEKKNLMKELDNLKMVYNEIKLAQEDQQKKLLELSVDHLHRIKEPGFSQEMKRKLETDLRNLQKRNRDLKLREQSLISLLHAQNREFGHWETQITGFLDKMIMANIREAFLEDKNREINESCWRLSEMKEAEIKLLKESLNSLVGENDRLTSHLAMYASALVSLRDCVSSLEIRTGMHKANYKIFKDVEMMNPSLVGSQSEAVQKIRSLVPEGFLEMQDIQLRIKAIEEAILEMDGPGVKEKSSSSGNLKGMVRWHEEGKLHLETVQGSRQVTRRKDKERLGESNDPRMHKPTVQVSQTGTELMKDIVLDQDSGCSSYRPRRRGTSEANDRMLELWETTDTSGSIDLKVGKTHKVDLMSPSDKVESCKEHSTPNSSRELVIVKEVGVDNLEISESSAASRRGRSKRKILDKLSSDAQKLTNLQITVKDLKRKVETTEQGRIGRSIQCSNLKDQLEEAEAAIMNSFDANYKLMSSTEDNFMSSSTKSNEESEGCGNIRKKISEQVKRESEKICVLQSEVQKIQFQLLKLDDEKESQGRTRVTERKTRILLKDYLSVRVKNNQKRKKAPLCACVPARRN